MRPYLYLSDSQQRASRKHTHTHRIGRHGVGWLQGGGGGVKTHKQTGKREREREAETSCCKVKDDVKFILEVKYRELFDPQHTVL